MAPLSAGGKAFCVVYSALGLPASLALVAVLRRRLLPVLSCPGAWVAIRWQLAPAQAALLQAAGLGLLVACVFVVLPALVLWAVQGGCSLVEAIYFCFSSLSTIGLGDLLPGQGRGLHPAIYRLGQFALLGESRKEEGAEAWTSTPIDLEGLQLIERSYPKAQNGCLVQRTVGAMLRVASSVRVGEHTGKCVGSSVSAVRAALTASSPQVTCSWGSWPCC